MTLGTLSDEAKLRFDAELMQMRTPRDVLTRMILLLDDMGAGHVYTAYEYYGLMFKLREIHYRWEYGKGGHDPQAANESQDYPEQHQQPLRAPPDFIRRRDDDPQD